MAGIIANAQAGLFNSSYQGALGGYTGLGQSNEGVFANVATGNLILQRQDDVLKGLGVDASLLRTYNSSGIFDGDNADGWRLGFMRNLAFTGPVNTQGSRINRIHADGAIQSYIYNAASNSYISTDGSGAHDSIQYNSTEQTYLYKDGDTLSTEQYDVNGRLQNILDENGKGIYLTYDAAGKLDTALVDGALNQQVIDFQYENDLLIAYQVMENGVSTKAVTYGYDANDRLETVTIDLTPTDLTDNVLQAGQSRDGKLFVTRYAYDSNDRISKIYNNDQQVQAFEYYADGRLKSITAANNQKTSFTYTSSNETRVRVGDSTNIYRFNAQDQLLSHHILEADGNESLVVSYQYEQKDQNADGVADGNILSMTDGEGRLVEYRYDAQGNRIRERDSAGNTLVHEYNSQNQLIRSHQFKSQPLVSLDSVTVPSAAQSTQYVYDASGRRLRFQVSPEGRVTEFVYNAFGQIEQERHYLTSYNQSQGLSLAQLDSWESDYQLIRYSYDFRGQLASQTRFSGINGGGVASTTEYVYDQRGRLLKQVAPEGVATTQNTNDFVSHYVYDTLGRLIQSTDAEGQVTHIAYQESQQRILTTAANGLITTRVVDFAGRTVSMTQGKVLGQSQDFDAFGSQSFFYNDEGQLVVSVDQLQQPTYYFYNEKGQLAYQVDVQNRVTGFEYDLAGNLIKTTRFASLNGQNLGTLTKDNNGNLTVTGLISTEQFAANQIVDTQDRVSRSFYDDANRKAFDQDAEGFVIAYHYDDFGRLLTSKAYEKANVISVSGSKASLLATAGSYRLSRNIYDKDGLLVGTLDAGGYLIEYRYDGAGNQIARISYADKVPVSSGARETADLAALRPVTTTNGNNRTHYWFYNGQGQLTGELSADNQVTGYQYDRNGNVQSVTQYHDLVTNYSGGKLSFPTGNSTKNQTTIHTYDELNRLESTTSANGLQTRFSYDSAGNLVLQQSQAADESGQIRTQRWKYDERGLLIAELDAELVSQLDSEEAIQAAFATQGRRYTYDALGRRISATDAEDQTSYFYYNQTGQLEAVVNHFGNVVRYEYNHFGEQIRSHIYRTGIPVNVLSNKVLKGGQYSDISSWLVAQIADPQTTNTIYNRRGLVDSQISAGIETRYQYNAFAELIKKTTAASSGATQPNVTSYLYDERGLLDTTVFDSAGLYNADGSLVSDYLSALEQMIHVEVEYDAFKRLIKEIDAAGNVTEYSYGQNEQGRKILTVSTGYHQSETNAVKQSKVTVYDAFDRTLSIANELGYKTQFQYDDQTRTHSRTSAQGLTLTTIYNAFGEIQSSTLGNNTSRYEYDHNGQLLKTFVGNDLISRNQYDANGRLELTVDGELRTIEYLQQRRSDGKAGIENITIQHVTDALGQQQVLKTSVIQDSAGFTLTETNASGQSISYLYDTNGRLASEITAKGTADEHTTRYSYDAAGNQISVTQGYGTAQATVTSYLYDNLGRLTQQTKGTGAQQQITSYQYDGNGNVLRQEQGSAAQGTLQVTSYVYDANQQLVLMLAPDGALTRYHYDRAGQRIATSQYTQEFTGDIRNKTAVDNFIQSTQALTNYVIYDKDGRVSHQVNADGGVTQLVYNNENKVKERISFAKRATIVNDTLLTALISGQAGTAISTLKLQSSTDDSRLVTLYDANGRVVFTLQRQAGNKAIVQENRYDKSGQLTETVAYASGELNYSASYDLDSLQTLLVDHLMSNDSKNQTTRFFYDEAARLRFTLHEDGSVNELNYTGTQLSRETQHGFLTLNGAPTYDRLVAASVKNLDARHKKMQFDSAGRMTELTDAAGNKEYWSYYDNGLKATYTDKKGNVWNYKYDNAGRLTEEIGPKVTSYTYGTDGQLQATSLHNVTKFIYNNLGYVTEQQTGQKTSPTATNWNAGYVSSSFSYDNAGRQTLVIAPADTTTKTLLSEVSYNALGQAYYQKVISDAAVVVEEQYKLYDNLGRLAYEVDAEGYVTGYEYNALGQLIATTRYEKKLNLTGDQQLSAEGFKEQYGLTAGRTIQYQYDQSGRKTKVIEPLVSYYDAVSPTQRKTASPVTEYVYNSFGDVVETRRYTSTQSYQSSFSYYDEMGRKTLEVNAEGYINKWVYNQYGEVESYIEYAKAINTVGLSIDMPPAAAQAAGQTGDRVWSYEYDELGRQIKQTQLGYKVFQLNGQNLTSASNAVVRRTEYDALGNIVKITAPDGSALVQEYDALSRLISSIEQQRVTVVAAELLGSSGLQNQTNAAAGQLSQYKVTRFKYDHRGNQVEVRQLKNGLDQSAATGLQFTESSQDLVLRSRYDLRGNLLQSTDAAGIATRYEVDHRGRILTERTAYTDGTLRDAVTSYSYDKLGNQTAARIYRDGYDTEKAQQTTWVQSTFAIYNAYGELTHRGNQNFSNHSLYQERFYYDSNGRLFDTTEGNGVRKEYRYDLLGNLVYINDLASGVTLFEYNKLGQAVGKRTPALNQPVNLDGTSVQQEVVQQVETINYDRWNNILSHTKANTATGASVTTSYEYDHENRLVKETQPAVKVVTAAGVQSSYQRPVFENFYDTMGRLIASKDANGHFRFNYFDTAGQLIRTTDPSGVATHYGYDVFGRQIAEQLGSSASDRYISYRELDANGRVLSVNDFSQNSSGIVERRTISRHVYNELGYETQRFDALNNKYQFWYDQTGNLVRSVTPDGVIKSYAWDAMGRKTAEFYGELGDVDQQTWRYHNYFNRLIAHKDLGGQKWTYAYVGESGGVFRGLQAETRVNGVLYRQYDYYNNGQLASVRNDGSVTVNGRAVSPYVSYRYDELGRIIEERNVSLDSLNHLIDETTYTTYDSLDRISTVTVYDNLSLQTKVQFRYGYDAVGNRTKVDVLNAYTGNISLDLNQGPEAVQSSVGVVLQPLKVTRVRYAISELFSDPNQRDRLILQLLQHGNPQLPEWISYSSDGVYLELAFDTPAVLTAQDIQNLDLSIKATDFNPDDPQDKTRGLSAELALNITVASNQQVIKPVDLSGLEGDLYLGQPFSIRFDPNSYFKDPDGDELHFLLEAYGEPDWLDEFIEYGIDANNMAFIRTKPGQVLPQNVTISDLQFRLLATDSIYDPVELIFNYQVHNLYFDYPQQGLQLVEGKTNSIKLFGDGYNSNNDDNYFSFRDLSIADLRVNTDLSNLPLVFNAQTGEIRLVPELLKPGQRIPSPVTLEVEARVNGQIVKGTVDLYLHLTPQPPVYLPLTVEARTELKGLSIPAFTDASGSIVNYQVSGLPQGVEYEFDAKLNRLVLSGMASHTNNGQAYNVIVRAIDQSGQTTSAAFSLTVAMDKVRLDSGIGAKVAPLFNVQNKDIAQVRIIDGSQPELNWMRVYKDAKGEWLLDVSAAYRGELRQGKVQILVTTASGVTYTDAVDISLNFKPSDNTAAYVLVEAADGVNDPVAEGADAYNYFSHTFTFDDLDHGDTLHFSYSTSESGKDQLTLAELRRLFPWLEITEDKASGQVTIRNISNIPQSAIRKEIPYGITVKARDKTSAYGEGKIDIQVDPEFKWDTIPSDKILKQNQSFDVGQYIYKADGYDLLDNNNQYNVYYLNNGSWVRLSNQGDHPVLLNYTTGILTVNPAYQGPIEELKLAVRAHRTDIEAGEDNRDGDDRTPISNHFILAIDYAPQLVQSPSYQVLEATKNIPDTYIYFKDRNDDTPGNLNNVITDHNSGSQSFEFRINGVLSYKGAPNWPSWLDYQVVNAANGVTQLKLIANQAVPLSEVNKVYDIEARLVSNTMSSSYGSAKLEFELPYEWQNLPASLGTIKAGESIDLAPYLYRDDADNFKLSGIQYLSNGTWVNAPTSMLSINSEGRLIVHNYGGLVEQIRFMPTASWVKGKQTSDSNQWVMLSIDYPMSSTRSEGVLTWTAGAGLANSIKSVITAIDQNDDTPAHLVNSVPQNITHEVDLGGLRSGAVVLKYNNNTVEISASGDIRAADVGSYTIRIVSRSGDAVQVNQVLVTILAPAPQGDQVLKVGQTLSGFSLNIPKDQAGDAYTHEVIGLPAWASYSLDRANGKVSFSSSKVLTEADVGIFSIYVRSTNSTTSVSSTSYTLSIYNPYSGTPPQVVKVNTTPLFIGIKDLVVEQGAVLPEVTFVFKDNLLDGETLSAINISSLPAWLNARLGSNSAGEKTLTLGGVVINAAPDTYDFVISGSDLLNGAANQVQRAFKVTVTEPPIDFAPEVVDAGKTLPSIKAGESFPATAISFRDQAQRETPQISYRVEPSAAAAWIVATPTSSTVNGYNYRGYVFSGTSPTSFIGNVTIVVEFNDGKNPVISETLSINVRDPNLRDKPDQSYSLTLPSNSSAGQSLSLDALLKDLGTVVEHKIVGQPGFVSINSAHQISVNPRGDADVGVYEFYIDGKDQQGLTQRVNIILIIDRPVIASQGTISKTIEEGESIGNMVLEFSDKLLPDESINLSYNINNLPHGVIANKTTTVSNGITYVRLTFSGTPTDGAGQWSIPVVATDSNGRTASSTFSLTVEPAVPDADFTVPAGTDTTFDVRDYIGTGIAMSPPRLQIISITGPGNPGFQVSYQVYTDGEVHPGGARFWEIGNIKLIMDSEVSDAGLYTVSMAHSGPNSYVKKVTIYLSPVTARSFMVSSMSSSSGNSVGYSLQTGENPDYGLTLLEGQQSSIELANLTDGDTVSVSGLPDGMSYDVKTGTLSGSPVKGSQGDYQLTVSSVGADNSIQKQIVTLSVGAATELPVYQQQDLVVLENTTLQIPLNPIDAVNPQHLTYQFEGLPPGLVFDPASQSFTGKPAAGSRGHYQVNVSVTDLWGNRSQSQFLMEVKPNLAPIAPQIPDATAKVDQYLILPLPHFQDDVGDSVSYQLYGLPQGLVYDAFSHSIIGIPEVAIEGRHLIHVVGKDKAGNQTATYFSLDIQGNTAPEAPAELTQVDATQGKHFSYVLPAFADAEGDYLSYSLSALDADGNKVSLPSGLYFEAKSRTLWGTPAFPLQGDIKLVYQATDPKGQVSQVEFVLHVADAEQVPVVELGEFEAHYNTFFYLLAPELHQLVQQGAQFRVDNLPPGLMFSSSTAEIYGKPEKQAVGEHHVSILITTKEGQQTWYNLTIDVERDRTMTVPEVPVQYLVEGQWSSFKLPAVQSNYSDAHVHYSVIEKPKWLSFNSKTLTFSGRPPMGLYGETTVKVKATDHAGNLGYIRVSLVTMPYNTAPVAHGMGEQHAQTDSPIRINVAEGFSDPEGDRLTYSAQLVIETAWGDRRLLALPAGLSFDSATGILSGQLSEPGRYRIQITAKDDYMPVSQDFVLTVNQPPQVAGQTDVTVNADSRLNLPLNPFIDHEDKGNLRYEITGLPPGISFYPGSFNIQGYLPSDSVGDYLVTLTAIDTQGARSSTSFRISVTENQAPQVPQVDIIDLVAGDALAQSVAFQDAENDELQVSISGLPQWAWFDSSSQMIYGNVPMSEQGQFPVWLTAVDNQGRQTVHRIVLNVDNQLNATRLNVAIDQNFSYQLGTLPEGVNSADVASVSVNNLPVGFSYNPDTQRIEGRATADQVGSYMADVSIVLSNGVKYSQLLRLVVDHQDNQTDWTEVDQPGAGQLLDLVPQLLPVQAKEHEFLHVLIPGIANQVDPTSGEQVKFQLSGLPDGLYFDAQRGALMGTPDGQSAGSYQLTLSATNQWGKTVQHQFVLVIENNLAPLAPAVEAQLVEDGEPLYLQLPVFTDPDGDKVQYSLTGLPAGLMFDVNSRTVYGSPMAGAGSGVYTDGGAQIYSLSYTATDQHGNSNTISFNLTVTPKQSPLPAADIYTFEYVQGEHLVIRDPQLQQLLQQALADAAAQGNTSLPAPDELQLRLDGLPEGFKFAYDEENQQWEIRGKGKGNTDNAGFFTLDLVAYKDRSEKEALLDMLSDLKQQAIDNNTELDGLAGWFFEDQAAFFDYLLGLAGGIKDVPGHNGHGDNDSGNGNGNNGNGKGNGKDKEDDWDIWDGLSGHDKHDADKVLGYIRSFLWPLVSSQYGELDTLLASYDKDFSAALDSLTLYIQPNQAPVAPELPQVWFKAGQLNQYLLPEFTDPDLIDQGAELRYKLNNKPDWLHFDDDGRTLYALPPLDAKGDHLIELEVTDRHGNVTYAEFKLTVSNNSQGPHSSNTEAVLLTAGEQLSLDMAAYFAIAASDTTNPWQQWLDQLNNESEQGWGDWNDWSDWFEHGWRDNEHWHNTGWSSGPGKGKGPLADLFDRLFNKDRDHDEDYVDLGDELPEWADVRYADLLAGMGYQDNGNQIRHYKAVLIGTDELGNEFEMPLPNGVSIDAQSGVLQGLFSQPGQYRIAVDATDQWGRSARSIVSVSVNDAPRSPGYGTQSLVSDVHSVIVLPKFSDHEDGFAQHSLSYQVQGLPPGLSFDASHMLISGTVPFGSEGQYTITVIATDKAGAQSRDHFTLDVKRNQGPVAPALAPVLDLVDGEAWQKSVVFYDAEGDTLQYQITGLPEWARFDAETQSLRAQPPEGTNGLWNIHILVTDAQGRQASVETTLRVQGVQSENVARIQLPVNQFNYGQSYYLNAAALLPAWGHFIHFETQVMDNNGQYQQLANHSAANWLNSVDGVLSGTPQLDDIPAVPLQIKVIADDGLGNKAIIELTLDIQGPVAVPQKPLETVSGETHVIQLSKMFRGIEAGSYEYSLVPVDAEGKELAGWPGGIIPKVVSFDAQTGRLELALGALQSGDFKVQATAVAAEQVAAPVMRLARSFAPMSASATAASTPVRVGNWVTVTVGPRASEEHYSYQYDEAGRVVLEQMDGVNAQGKPRREETAYVYDNLGRQQYEIELKDDGFGDNFTDQALKYSYNRDGTLQGVEQSYSSDHKAFNNLIESRFNLSSGFNSSGLNWSTLSGYSYNAAGQVTEQRQYFDVRDSQTLKSGVKGAHLVDTLQGVQSFSYRGDGQTSFSTAWSREADEVYGYRLEGSGYQDTLSSGQMRTSTYFDGSSSYRYDRDKGLLSSQTNISGTGDDRVVQSYTYSYIGFDSYQQSMVKSHVSQEHYKDGYAYYRYDMEGNQIAQLSQKTDSAGKADGYAAVYYQYDLNGVLRGKRTGEQSTVAYQAEQPLTREQLLEKRRQLEFDEAGEFRRTEQGEQRAPDFKHSGGSSAAHYSYGGGGTYLGEFKEDGSINIRDTHFKPLDSETVAQSRSYTTQGGETLQNLAQMFLGDKDFWYLIAALNGLDSPDEALPQGKVLHIPAQGTASNSSDAFNPINLNEVLENYLPEAAFVPPPQKGCNAVASIIMIVVAVIATIYTAGAASSLFSATAISGAGGIGAAGAAALGGTVAGAGMGAAMGAAAIGGFVGSVASQLVGKALGAVDSFSLKGALTSGLTAGATAGAGSMLQGADWATKGAEGNQIFNNYGKAALAATATATSVAAGKLVGQQSSFRWGNVAASAVAAGIGGNTGIPGMDSFNPLDGIVQSGIRYGADKLFGNEASWNFDAVAVDAFGNALGNSIVASMSGAGTAKLKQRDDKRVAELVQAGVTPEQAVRMVAEEYYGSMRGQTEEQEINGAPLHGHVNKDQQFASDELVLGNGSDEARFYTGGVRTQTDAENVLGTIRNTLGDGALADMSLGYAFNRLTAMASARTAFDEGVVSGTYKVQQATAYRNATFNGFRGDLMTSEDWGRAIANQTRQWAQQNATSAMMFVAGVATLPMLAADLLAVGALAGRGTMALGRGLLNTTDDMGRSLYASYQATGIRGTLLSAASPTTSWTTVQLGAMTTARSAASRPSSLSTTDVLHGVNSLAWRTPYSAFGSSIHAAKAIMANPNAQAGFVSGLTNTAVDYYINGDKANLSASFIGGFAGGAFGSLAAQRLTSSIQPVVSGLIGGGFGEFMDQQLRGEKLNTYDIAVGALTGGLATVGVNKLFKVNTTITLTPPSPTQSTGAAMTGGFIGSYANSNWGNWYNQLLR